MFHKVDQVTRLICQEFNSTALADLEIREDSLAILTGLLGSIPISTYI